MSMIKTVALVIATVQGTPAPAPTNGLPWSACTTDANCMEGLTCQASQCQVDPSATCKQAFAECANSAQCCGNGASLYGCYGNSHWMSCQQQGIVSVGGTCYNTEQCTSGLFCNAGKCAVSPATPTPTPVVPVAPTPAPGSLGPWDYCTADAQCMEGKICTSNQCRDDPSATCTQPFVTCTTDAQCCGNGADTYACYGNSSWKACGKKYSVKTGGQCFADSQCVSGLFCNSGKCSATPSTPPPTPAPGMVRPWGACSATAQCMEGNVCTAGQCQASSTATCTQPWAQCTADAQCCGNGNNLMGCYGNSNWNMCLSKGTGALGSSCYSDDQCTASLYCNANKCSATPATPSPVVPVTPPPTPAPATVPQWGYCTATSQCAEGNLCQSNLCTPNPSATCTQPYAQCASDADCCGNSAGSFGCFGNQWWKSCQSIGTVALNGQCYGDAQCVSGLFCNNNKCSASPATPMPSPAPGSVALYQSCSSTAQCMEGANCASYMQCVPNTVAPTTCVMPWASCSTSGLPCCGSMYGCFGTAYYTSCLQIAIINNGASCYNDAQCISGNCDSSTSKCAP